MLSICILSIYLKLSHDAFIHSQEPYIMVVNTFQNYLNFEFVRILAFKREELIISAEFFQTVTKPHNLPS